MASPDHLRSIADNLQFIADLGYGDVALAECDGNVLTVIADARPMTAVAAIAFTRVGQVLDPAAEPEAYAALAGGDACAARRRSTRGIAFTTCASLVGPPDAPLGVILLDITRQVAEAPGKMERVFMSLAARVLHKLTQGPLLDLDSGGLFSTGRRAGDGVMEVDAAGIVTYGSPNAVNIMRMAGLDGTLAGRPLAELPGCATVAAPVLGSERAREMTVEVGGRVLLVRAIDLGGGAVVLVEDTTDVCRREQELRVKEATIREVHHRVKNNLQTIASLLRIQARHTGSDDARRALREAVERVSSMAVVHDMLAASTAELVDFASVERVVVDMVRQGLAGTSSDVAVAVEGDAGLVPGAMATSLALVTAELVHNAIEHGIGPGRRGRVTVGMRRFPRELHLVVRDDGVGLGSAFDLESSSDLGLAIVRTIVEDDLRGTLQLTSARGTTVTIIIPLERPAEEVE